FNNDLELTKKRINILIQYSLKLLDNKKINFIDIIEMADSKKNNRDVFYSKYYLKAAEEVLCTKESIKLYKKDRDKVDSILKDIERDNIIKYKYVFVEIINILLIKKCVDVEIDNMLNDIYDSKELFRKIREYCVSNNLIDKENNIKTLVELFSTLIEKLENNHYQVIDIELLKKRFNEFYENAKYINKIRESEVFSNVNLRKIEDQNQYFYIENEEEIGIYLKNLSQEKQIEYENMVFFQRLIKYIVENNIKVNKEEKEFILDIYKKMNRKELINDYQWFDILVNIERTLNEDSI
ncbi:hypothetical protein, partial [Inconstantimicrobium porci]|uniref:hypothetical protein n=1 Tax=Inconstantimicrobium porci TaxID=2652291 RepID=UPI00240A2B78